MPTHRPFIIPSSREPWRKGLLISNAFKVGKYLVSPLTRGAANGRFTAGVSIRCGVGSMTHDRVLRFVPSFDTADQASRFASTQARAWIRNTKVASSVSSLEVC